MHCQSAMWVTSPLFLVSLVLLVSMASWARNKVDAEKAGDQSSANANALKITLIASREQAVAGTDFGITAWVENVSTKPVYFKPSSFSMVAPPELDPGTSSEWWPLFPLIQDPNVDKTDWGKYFATVVTLTPRSKIPAFWSGRLRSSETSGLKGFLRNLNFSPGKYTLTVCGRYWDTPEGPTNKAAEPQTQSAELQEIINAPQGTILFGAALGGCFAFLLVWRINPSMYSPWEQRPWIGLVSSILLSIIVTILLARLSDSQFFIRVTVNDLWGAMAVGFIGAASGPAILQKFTKVLGGPVKQQEEQGKEGKDIPLAAGQDDGSTPQLSASRTT